MDMQASSEQALQEFIGQVFVITGDLERYSRKAAYSLIRRLGGETSDNPINSMNYLILGRAIWSELNNGTAPRKVVKAQQLIENGSDIQILSEDEFYEMLDAALPVLDEADTLFCDSEELTDLLVSLGIPQVGEETARLLSRRFRSMDNIASAGFYELSEIDSIGASKARVITEWFTNPKNCELVMKLRDQQQIGESTGVYSKSQEAERDYRFLGLTFVVTGTLTVYKRNEIVAIIESLGGRTASSVSKKTSYLVVGDNAGSKLAKAESLGIPVITEQRFTDMLNAII